MKTFYALIACIVISVGLLGCRLIPTIPGTTMIKPSETVVTENRNVSGFTGVSMTTVGKVTITQGDTESLVIQGSNNVLPLIETNVVNNVLIIKMKDGYSLEGLNQDNLLTFTIGAKDLSSLEVSGLGTVEMGSLKTPTLKVDMSGAGAISLNQLTVKNLDVSLSGVGKVTLAGTATTAKFTISGAGGVEAGDLQCQTANVDISGLGPATLWVTDSLTGEISGAGSVSYYGNPSVHTTTSGLGEFKSLGSK